MDEIYDDGKGELLEGHWGAERGKTQAEGGNNHPHGQGANRVKVSARSLE